MRLSRPAIAAILAGVVITGVLSGLAYARNDSNESRLLKLQTQEAGAILQLIVPVVETPLSSAAQIAVVTNGAKQQFAEYVTPFVGPKGSFVSVSLWRVDGRTATMIGDVGSPLLLDRVSGRAATFFAEASHKQALHVGSVLGDGSPVGRLGYSFAARRGAASYVVYAESVLPANRRAPKDPTSPLAGLNFALYLGPERTDASLLESSTPHLPITGRTAMVTVPFGDRSLTLVTTPITSLSGSVSASLWWILIIGGALITTAAAAAAERLTRRRYAAERLTAEVQNLLGQQRTISEALQRALLPEGTPSVAGMRIASRYFAGEHGLEIGGDWYDVVPLGDSRFFFAVGDVSGRGVRAGAVMAALRFAIRGFVSEGHGPAEVLDRLGPVIAEVGDGLIATVLCGLVDVTGHAAALSTAGHPPPVLVAGDRSDFVDVEIGPPVGVRRDTAYATTAIRVPPAATLIAYTDGLVERREESLDVGLERLREVAAGAGRSAHDTADALVAALVDAESDDDTAVLVMQWAD